MRMGSSALPAYVRAIEDAQQRFRANYSQNMECGRPVSISYFDDAAEVWQTTWRWDAISTHTAGAGSAICGHSRCCAPAGYTKHLVESMRSRLFSFVATRIFWADLGIGIRTQAASRDILSTARELQLLWNQWQRPDKPCGVFSGYEGGYLGVPFGSWPEYEVTGGELRSHHPEFVDQGLAEGLGLVESLA